MHRSHLSTAEKTAKERQVNDFAQGVITRTGALPAEQRAGVIRCPKCLGRGSFLLQPVPGGYAVFEDVWPEGQVAPPTFRRNCDACDGNKFIDISKRVF